MRLLPDILQILHRFNLCGDEKYFLNIDARFSGGGIMLYVAPLLDLDLNYSLQSIICWIR